MYSFEINFVEVPCVIFLSIATSLNLTWISTYLDSICSDVLGIIRLEVHNFKSSRWNLHISSLPDALSFTSNANLFYMQMWQVNSTTVSHETIVDCNSIKHHVARFFVMNLFQPSMYFISWLLFSSFLFDSILLQHLATSYINILRVMWRRCLLPSSEWKVIGWCSLKELMTSRSKILYQMLNNFDALTMKMKMQGGRWIF